MSKSEFESRGALFHPNACPISPHWTTCCCWLEWWLHGRSTQISCCVGAVLWRLLWLKQKKVSWRQPWNSRLKSRSVTHPYHENYVNRQGPGNSLHSQEWLWICTKAGCDVCCSLSPRQPHNMSVFSFRSWMKIMNGPRIILGSTCWLWLPKEFLWVLPSPQETLPSPTFSSTTDVSHFSKLTFQTRYST